MAGFALIDFYDDSIRQTLLRQVREYVLCDHALCFLFKRTPHPTIEPGPYLPAHLYLNSEGEMSFLIIEALSEEDLADCPPFGRVAVEEIPGPTGEPPENPA